MRGFSLRLLVPEPRASEVVSVVFASDVAVELKGEARLRSSGQVAPWDDEADEGPFRGTEAQYDVMIRACQPDPDDRYQAEDAFLDAWRIAGG